MKTLVGYVDITPTWEAVLPIWLEVVRNDDASPEARRNAVAELTRMAQLADRIVATTKGQP